MTPGLLFRQGEDKPDLLTVRPGLYPPGEDRGVKGTISHRRHRNSFTATDSPGNRPKFSSKRTEPAGSTIRPIFVRKAASAGRAVETRSSHAGRSCPRVWASASKRRASMASIPGTSRVSTSDRSRAPSRFCSKGERSPAQGNRVLNGKLGEG